MEWLMMIGSVIAITVSILGLLKSISILWRWVWDKAIIHHFPEKLIQIYPVNEQGSNVVIRREEWPPSLEEYIIKINFDLCARFPITIVRIKICPDLIAISKFLDIKINGKALDKSNPYEIKKGETVKIRISKGLTCNWGDLDALYYGPHDIQQLGDIKVILNLSSEKWNGIKKIEVSGTLFPLGKLQNLRYRYLKQINRKQPK